MHKPEVQAISYISYHYHENPNFRSSAIWNIVEKNFPDSYFFFANWNHIKKEKFTLAANHRIHKIEVPKYNKNISLDRIFSHIVFSVKLFFKKEIMTSKIIICSVPTNLAIIPLLLIKLIKPKTRIIIDIVDIWPEAIPLNKNTKKIFNKYLENLKNTTDILLPKGKHESTDWMAIPLMTKNRMALLTFLERNGIQTEEERMERER